jgi:membrane protein implicated in regulation of membrane protease activity
VIGFFSIWHLVSQIRKEAVIQRKCLRLLLANSPGQNSVIGRMGTMQTPIDSSQPVGEVRIDDEGWSCTSAGGHIGKGAQVRVTGIKGLNLVVETAVSNR